MMSNTRSPVLLDPQNLPVRSCHLPLCSVSEARALVNAPTGTEPSNLYIPLMTMGIDDINLFQGLLLGDLFHFTAVQAHHELSPFQQFNLFKAVCFLPPNCVH